MLINGVEVDIEKILQCEGNEVKAIKKIRELTGTDLTTARNAVKSHEQKIAFNNANGETDDKTFYKELKKIPGYDSFGTKKEIKHLKKFLYTDESVFAIASGIMDGTTWLIACTNKRILFIDCGLIYGVKHSEITINKINAVSFKNGLVLGEIHIEDGASTRVIKNVQKTSTKPFVDAVHKAIEMQNNSPIPQQANVSIADELLKFKQLLDMGAITNQEFEDQKQKLLNSQN